MRCKKDMNGRGRIIRSWRIGGVYCRGVDIFERIHEQCLKICFSVDFVLDMEGDVYHGLRSILLNLMGLMDIVRWYPRHISHNLT
jgi:hypothetical protein